MIDHVENMRKKYPKLSEWTDSEIEELYNDNNSHSQSMRCRGGGEIERYVETALRDLDVPFARQVPINKDGIIVNTKKNMKVIDIVFGNPEVGTHVSNYIVMSIKRSSRERHSEDEWTLTQKPKIYIYATLKDDYPPPEKFQESSTRMLVCAKPKTVDTRTYKLGFEDIVSIVRPHS